MLHPLWGQHHQVPALAVTEKCQVELGLYLGLYLGLLLWPRAPPFRFLMGVRPETLPTGLWFPVRVLGKEFLLVEVGVLMSCGLQLVVVLR